MKSWAMKLTTVRSLDRWQQAKTETMKNLLLLISVLYTINNLAQNPNPDLFQTWYLESVQVSDAAPIYQVAEIEPDISPTLVILESFDFNGQGACNTFEGKFNIPTTEIIETIEFSNSTDDCGISQHNLFEDSYFGFLQWVISYEIIPDGNDLKLTMGTATFGQAIFKNYTLSTTDFELNKIKVFPNPTNSILFTNSQNKKISKVDLLNTNGQCIITAKNNVHRIDLSELPSGIYLMRIHTEDETFCRKIVKN